MPPVYGALDASTVVKTLAAASLTQLYRSSFFARAAVTEFNDQQLFEKGQATSISRPKDSGTADDYDPRSGTDAGSTEPGNVIINLTLERLFTKGFPVYSHDADPARYIRDYSQSNAGALRKSFDNYLYNTCARTYSIAASGAVNYAANAPIQIVASAGASSFNAFDSDTLINAGTVLNSRDVPGDGRYVALSSAAAGAFLGDAVLVEGFTATAAGSATLLQGGMGSGVMVNRYGFMTGLSNAAIS